MAISQIDLEKWKAQHPRSSKWHPRWFVDCNTEGTKQQEWMQVYSWTATRNLVIQRDNYGCRVCPSDKDIEVQHIIPRKNGGADHPSNLITLCKKCHVKTFRGGYGGIPGVRDKNQRAITEFLQEA